MPSGRLPGKGPGRRSPFETSNVSWRSCHRPFDLRDAFFKPQWFEVAPAPGRCRPVILREPVSEVCIRGLANQVALIVIEVMARKGAGAEQPASFRPSAYSVSINV